MNNTSTNSEIKVEINAPDPVTLSEVWDNLPPLTPPIIDGVLRQGHKMMVAGPSKAGKTFLLMELALCVASGKPWIGLVCRKGKVLYINLELDDNSCFHRFKKIGQERGIENVCNVSVWNMRGENIPFEDLAHYIADMAKRDNYTMVILDPIYKLFTGSENNQEVVADFCRNLDVIVKAGASVVYCHHHSKGTQANKDSMDRASGSGVFARDADALIDMVQLVPGEDANIDCEDGITAWLISFTLREFKYRNSEKVLFNYPLHTVCNDGRLDTAKIKGSFGSGGQKRARQLVAQKTMNKANFEQECKKRFENNICPSVSEMAKLIGKDVKTIRRYASELGYTVALGKIYDKDNRTDWLNSLLSESEEE